MSKEIEKLRKKQRKAVLDISELSDNPVVQFTIWFQDAIKAKLYEPEAMTLATLDSRNRPSARMVLLKSVNERGFTFFSNYQSRKGNQLAVKPVAALVFWWPELERQVRVEGKVSKISAKRSDEYFASRPRGSQIAATVSKQSEVLQASADLQKEWEMMAVRLEGQHVKRPQNWGGYCLKPRMIEFWQGKPDRLHTRIRYRWQKNHGWIKELIYP